jgi:hypothetical protein
VQCVDNVSMRVEFEIQKIHLHDKRMRMERNFENREEASKEIENQFFRKICEDSEILYNIYVPSAFMWWAKFGVEEERLNMVSATETEYLRGVKCCAGTDHLRNDIQNKLDIFSLYEKIQNAETNGKRK